MARVPHLPPPMPYLDPDHPDPAVIHRGQRCLITASCMAVIGGSAVAAPFITVVALKMGASPLYIGALQAMHLGSWFFQLLTMQQVQRRGKKRVVVLWGSLIVLVLLPLLALPEVWAHFGRERRGWALGFLVAVLALRHLAKGLGQTGWMPLIQDNVPPDQRGRFFGRMRTFWQGMLVLWLLGLGLFVGEDADWEVIRLIFVIAVLCNAGFLLCLLPVGEYPPVGKTVPLVQLVAAPFRDRRFRWALLYLFSYSMALGLADPFRVVYLKVLGFSDRVLLFGPATLFLGGILTLRGWGRLVDHLGNRAAFSICHVGMMMTVIGWLFVDAGTVGLTIAMILFGLTGVFNGGQGIAVTRYLFTVIDRSQQASYVTMASVLGMGTIGLAVLAGGVFLKFFAGLHFEYGAFNMNAYHVLFLVSGLLFCVPHAVRGKLRQGVEHSSADVIAIVTRPLRLMLGNFVVGAPDDRE